MSANIALISPIKPYYSETFIQAHIDLLPFEIHHFHSLPKMGFYPIFAPSGRALFSQIKVIQYIEGAIDIITGRRGIGYYFRKKPFKKYLLNQKIELVFVEYGPTGVYVMNECKATNTPLIVHFHGRDAYLYKNINLYKNRYKTLFSIASYVIAVSLDMKDQLIRLGCPKEKVIVTPCGPNPALFSFADTSANQEIIIGVGRFCDKKAPLLTIKSFEIALKQRPSLKLTLLGDGPLLEECRSYVKQRDLSSQITLPGRIEHQKIHQMMSKSKAFIQHSVRAADGDSEGMPVSVAEAMLVGLPVIATIHAGIPDVVIHKETGYLSEEKDVSTMAEGILWVFDDEIRRQELGRKGNERITNHFSMQHHINKLTQVINESINETSS